MSSLRKILPEFLIKPLRAAVNWYNHRPLSLLNPRFDYQLRGLALHAFSRARRPSGPRFLFYPQPPKHRSIIYKICFISGYRITCDPALAHDLAFSWEIATHRNPDATLAALDRRTPVINLRCTDISKRRVDEVFREVFGYSLMIDPRQYRGPCVAKSDLNAEHDGRILQCPVETVQEGSVYQRLVNNRVEGDLVMDIRVPVLRDHIPFAYIKYHHAAENVRFREAHAATLAELSERVSAGEARKILEFCARIGLDFGELDMLRDNDDGRLYIVDVNNTPRGPPRTMSPRDHWHALRRYQAEFERMFLRAA